MIGKTTYILQQTPKIQFYDRVILHPI